MQIDISDIKSMPLFQGIGENDLSQIMRCISPVIKKYGKGETAALMYEPLKGVGVILSGEAEVKRENASGSRLIMGFIEKGDVFGEMAAFSGSRVWPATVTAKTECAMMYIPAERFLGGCEKSCAAHKILIQNMLRIISGKTVSLSRKLEYSGIRSMRAKLCAYLLEQSNISGSPTFILTMNRNELADYLGVSRPSMSRELGRLKYEGVIDFYMSSVRILDMDSLKKCAM